MARSWPSVLAATESDVAVMGYGYHIAGCLVAALFAPMPATWFLGVGRKINSAFGYVGIGINEVAVPM